MTDSGIHPWLFEVEPYEGESLSHFLGRVRRCNLLTASGLGKLAEIGGVVKRWERFHLNPYPKPIEFEKLGAVLRIAPERLWALLPAKGVKMKCEPIRLCGACYAENPCHQIEWQLQSKWKCERHNLKLLSKCPKCGAKFKLPSEWEYGCCSRCKTAFKDLSILQTST